MQLCLRTAGLFLLTTSPAFSVDFNSDVAPVLIQRCLECHKGAAPSGGLSLETANGLKAGGDSGPVVSPGNPGASVLLARINSGEMPPPVKGVPQHLSVKERKVITEWIQSGAKWPSQRRLDLYEVTTKVRGGRDWWAFQPLKRPSVPVVKHPSVETPVDAFILAKLLLEEMRPAPRADAATLVRRLYFDTIGLPPTYDELQMWSQQISQQGVQPLVRHLLQSPHFGERRARYWLDLVRYAETSGYERDQPKPFAWKYRDWVVNAFNKDMPYNQFVLHQIAGDEIPERSEPSLIATGFLRLGTWNDEPNDNADYQYDRLEDLVHATSSAFLGLTVKCARCHDHKFDPIPQDDYYRMASIFWPGPVAARDRKLLGGPTVEELGADDVLGWTDITATPSPLHVLHNGERHSPLHAVIPGTLTFSPELHHSLTEAPKGSRTSGRRRQFGEWVADRKNPLTARVWVNRIWQYHFGEGLVRSPNNFGFKGELPTHPKLLDWLASELIDNNWSTKHIDNLILSSSTWQQSSLHTNAEEYEQRDSANRFWWHANRRRLDAETLRDSMLSVSGEIDLQIGGEGFKPAISEEALEGFSRKSSVWTASPEEKQRRRSLYIFVSRSLMPPMMTTFDQCDTTLPCAQRNVTTVAPQALAMMNNAFTHSRSAAIANRVKTVASSLDEQIHAAWRFVLKRDATPGELELARTHVAQLTREFRQQDTQQIENTSRQLPDPILHLTAKSGVEIDKTGRVSVWKAVTGQIAKQQGAAARPKYDREGINGKPAVHFNGAGRFLELEGDVISNAHCTIIAVANDHSRKPGLREIISNWDGSAGNSVNSVFLGLRDTSHVRFSDQFSSSAQLQDRHAPFVLTAANGPDGTAIWQNGTSLGHRKMPLSDRRFHTAWVIGQQGNINGEFWNGHIAEVLVFDRPLSASQRQIVWKSLHAEYRVPLPMLSPPATATETPSDRALTSLCHVLLNSNEFLYID